MQYSRPITIRGFCAFLQGQLYLGTRPIVYDALLGSLQVQTPRPKGPVSNEYVLLFAICKHPSG